MYCSRGTVVLRWLQNLRHRAVPFTCYFVLLQLMARCFPKLRAYRHV